MLTVKVMNEAGYSEALFGLSLSYNAPVEKMPAVAAKLAHRGGGESKFLESMFCWLDVRAPRYWWQEADTYRIATKQSESTMHTILRRALGSDDFQEDGGFEEADPGDEEFERLYLEKLNQKIAAKRFRWVKRHLFESFFQRREWCMSYATLQRLWYQRHQHKLPEWHQFLDTIIAQIQHPEFVVRADAT